MKKDKITQLQLFCLFNLFVFTTILAFTMNILISESHYTSVFALVGGGLISSLIIYPSYLLAAKRPDRFFIHYGKQIVGKWLHSILMIFLLIIFIIIAATNLWELADFLTLIYLQGTPSWAVSALFGVCVYYAVRKGIITIFRAAGGIFVLSLISFIAIPLMVRSDMHLGFAAGLITHFEFTSFWDGAFYVMVIFGEMTFILFLYPYIEKPEKTFKTKFGAIITSLIICTSHLIPILLIFGPYMSANFSFPDMELIRYMRAGTFIETVDPIIIVLWLSSLFIKVSFLVYIVVSGIARSFNLQDHKPLSSPVTAFVVIVSIIMVKSAAEFVDFEKTGWFALVFIAELIPILYWIVDLIRFKGEARL